MRIIFTIFLILWANSAIAQSTPETAAECGQTVDMSDRFVGPRDQGHAGFCYSFTASDLLSEAVGLKPPATISAFHSAAEYISMNQEEVAKANASVDSAYSKPVDQVKLPTGGMMGGMGAPPDSANTQNFLWRQYDPKGKGMLLREGGYIDLIAAHLTNEGRACLESDVPSQILLRSSEDHEQQNFFGLRMGKLGGGDYINKNFNSLPSQQPIIIADTKDPMCFRSQMKNFEFRRPVENINSSIQDWAALKLRDSANAMCKNPVKLPSTLKVHRLDYSTMGYGGTDVRNARRDVKNLLDKGRPLGLSFDACVMINCKSGERDPHAVVIVGKQWNQEKHRCELKIKNSWGESCKSAKPGIDCKNGYWNIPADEVYKGWHEITWIDK